MSDYFFEFSIEILLSESKIDVIFPSSFRSVVDTLNIAILRTQGADPSVRQNKKRRSDYQWKNEKGRNTRRTNCKERRGERRAECQEGHELSDSKDYCSYPAGQQAREKNAKTEKATRLLSGRNRNGERKEELVSTGSTVRINLISSFKNKLSGNGTDKQQYSYLGYGTFFWLAVVLTSKSNVLADGDR